MNIGVDAGSLRDVFTGIGWYVWRVLPEMARLSPADVFQLYASRRLRCSFEQTNLRTRMAQPPLPLPGIFWQQLQARHFARRDQLDCFWGPAHLLPLTLPNSVRTVLTVHDLVSVLFPESMTRYNAFVHRLYFAASVRRADAIITVSDATRKDLVRRLGADPQKITVIPQGIEDDFRSADPEPVRERLSSLGIHGAYLLCVGTLEPRKNYPLLLRALAKVPDDIQLIIAGRRGWKFQSVLEEIRRLKLDGRVKLLDYVPIEDLVALYNGARMLVLPSVYEGFGLPILQAMACGCPVLASNCSSLPEIGGDAAAYFEPGSVDSLAGAIAALIEDDQLRDRMRARGLDRAKSFTWRRTAERTLAVLHSQSAEPEV